MRVVMKGRTLWLMMRITTDAIYYQWLLAGNLLVLLSGLREMGYR